MLLLFCSCCRCRCCGRAGRVRTFLALFFVPPEEVFPLAMSALGRLLLGKELFALSAKLRLSRLKSIIFASTAFFHPSFASCLLVLVLSLLCLIIRVIPSLTRLPCRSSSPGFRLQLLDRRQPRVRLVGRSLEEARLRQDSVAIVNPPASTLQSDNSALNIVWQLWDVVAGSKELHITRRPLERSRLCRPPGLLSWSWLLFQSPLRQRRSRSWRSEVLLQARRDLIPGLLGSGQEGDHCLFCLRCSKELGHISGVHVNRRALRVEAVEDLIGPLWRALVLVA